VSIESVYATSYYSLTVTMDVSLTVFDILTLKARMWHVFPTALLFDDFVQRESVRISGLNLLRKN